jgi:hypothetical protein
MAIKYIIVLFVETPRKFITALIRGVSTNKTIIFWQLFIKSRDYNRLRHSMSIKLKFKKTIQEFHTRL